MGETNLPSALYEAEPEHYQFTPSTPYFMSRNLYSPNFSDDVVRALYREGQRRRLPMTRLADALLRQALASISAVPPHSFCASGTEVSVDFV